MVKVVVATVAPTAAAYDRHSPFGGAETAPTTRASQRRRLCQTHARQMRRQEYAGSYAQFWRHFTYTHCTVQVQDPKQPDAVQENEQSYEINPNTALVVVFLAVSYFDSEFPCLSTFGGKRVNAWKIVIILILLAMALLLSSPRRADTN